MYINIIFIYDDIHSFVLCWRAQGCELEVNIVAPTAATAATATANPGAIMPMEDHDCHYKATGIWCVHCTALSCPRRISEGIYLNRRVFANCEKDYCRCEGVVSAQHMSVVLAHHLSVVSA